MEAMEKKEETVAGNEPKHRGIIAMPFVIGNETFEKLGTLGISSHLLIYLTTIFKMNTMTATTLMNIFTGTCNFGTLIGAYLSDTYFGRYNTLAFASVSSFLGMLLLTVTAALPKLHPPPCTTTQSSACTGPKPWQTGFLLIGFGFLVVGASGIRPCNLAFGADQFNPKTESGRRGINGFFNWYYFTYTFAVMASLTVIIYVQSNVNWGLGLAIPTILMFFSCALFFAGTGIYVRLVPRGSPLTGVAQVLAAAFRKRRLELPEQPSSFLFNHSATDSINLELPYTDQFQFLNKGAIITPEDPINCDGSPANPWRLSTVQQIEEVKCVLRVIPIWAAGITYYVSIVQQHNYVVFQALQSNRTLGNTGFKIPAATYILFTMLSLTVWLPLYDRIVLPMLRRLAGKEDGITLLQKIGTGMVLSVISMLVSGLVENKRRLESRTGNVSSMSGSWLIGQLVLMGLSEAFTVIGENEFFYKQFPENMRSIAASFLFIGMAGSSYLSSFLAAAVQRATSEGWLAEDLNKGRLDYFYYLIGGLEILNLGYFLVCATPNYSLKPLLFDM